MSTSMENPVVLNLMDTYGSLLLGVLFSAMAWGISCAQIFMYFLNYESDSSNIKLLVLILWSVDTAGEVLMIKSLFPTLILQWGYVAGVSKTQSGLIHHTWIAAILAISVQMFFLYRIYIFSGRRWLLPVILTVISWWQLVEAIYYVIKAFKAQSLAGISTPEMTHMTVSARATSAGLDIVIAAAMTFLLMSQGQSVHPRSKQIVFRLIIMTIISGMWTAIVALIHVCLIVTHPDNLLYTIFEFPLSPIYVNTLLANLNARHYLRGRETEINSATFGRHVQSNARGVISLGPLKFWSGQRKRTDTTTNYSSQDGPADVHQTVTVLTDVEDHPDYPEPSKQNPDQLSFAL